MPWQTALATPSSPWQPAPIFHLHWEDAVYRMEPSEEAAHHAAQTFLTSLEAYQERGGSMFWTVHNEQPHDGRYLQVHEALCAALSTLANMVVVHHPSAMQFVQRRWGVDARRIAIVPHGNYQDVYAAAEPDRETRRIAAGYARNDRVLLLFGRLDSYKGVEDLLRELGQLQDRRLHLIIAGKKVAPFDAALAALPAETRARVTVRHDFVPAAEVPDLFDLADIVVAPYRAVLTSGTVMLAFSLGRPVLAPKLPGVLEWVRDGDDGLLYEQTAEGGLRSALERLMLLSTDELLRLQRTALETARRHEWAVSHNLMQGLYAYRELQARPPRLCSATDWYTLD